MAARFACEVSDLRILRDDRASLAGALRQATGSHDLILTTGGVSTGDEDHVKSGGRDCRIACAMAHGHQAGTSSCDGHHRGNAVHRPAWKSRSQLCDFCARRSANDPCARRRHSAKTDPMPVGAAFGYKKKIGRREYVRVSLRWGRRGFWRPKGSHARARALFRHWWRLMGWSNSARRSLWSNPARQWAFYLMQS